VLEHKGPLNIQLVEGNILETVPEYATQRPELRIALLHIDVDVYSSTLTALACLYERVVRDKIVILDDFGTVA
jgi:hypothetical protein